MAGSSARGSGPLRRVGPPERVDLPVPRYRQPDDVTCGPTCLLQVLHYYEDRRTFAEVAASIDRNPDGGTFAAILGNSALRFGYEATLYPFGLRVFDPTWFELDRASLMAKLLARADVSPKRKVKKAARAYATYLELGGKLRFTELSPKLLVSILAREHPVLCGLSSTWLYRHPREQPDTMMDDDVGGEPQGHFVVICGYERRGEEFLVCDPWSQAPFGESGRYTVPAHRLVNAILLGDVTYDAVLLEVAPRTGS